MSPLLESSVELLIFDCDGVLVDSELIANRLLQQGLRELGLSLTLQETMDRFMGKSLASCEAELAQQIGKKIDPAFWQRLRIKTFAAFDSDLKPVPGVENALANLHLPKCVASSGKKLKMRKTLGLTGLDNNLFSATEVEQGKPAPDLFLYAAEKMNCAPGHCVVIEDSQYGVEAGVNAGMRVLGYCRHSSAELLTQKGAVVFDDMRDLPDLIDALSKPEKEDD